MIDSRALQTARDATLGLRAVADEQDDGLHPAVHAELVEDVLPVVPGRGEGAGARGGGPAGGRGALGEEPLELRGQADLSEEVHEPVLVPKLGRRHQGADAQPESFAALRACYDVPGLDELVVARGQAAVGTESAADGIPAAGEPLEDVETALPDDLLGAVAQQRGGTLVPGQNLPAWSHRSHPVGCAAERVEYVDGLWVQPFGSCHAESFRASPP